jgi:hypothetical protein
MTRCVYRLEPDGPGKIVTIRDIGHPTCCTVTNDVEAVVEELVSTGRLPEGWRLCYYDSIGNLDEILVKNGKFAGFKVGEP